MYVSLASSASSTDNKLELCRVRQAPSLYFTEGRMAVAGNRAATGHVYLGGSAAGKHGLLPPQRQMNVVAALRVTAANGDMGTRRCETAWR